MEEAVIGVPKALPMLPLDLDSRPHLLFIQRQSDRNGPRVFEAFNVVQFESLICQNVGLDKTYLMVYLKLKIHQGKM